MVPSLSELATTSPLTDHVPDGLLTTPDVARVFRTSESTVRYWRQQGTGPAWFKAGRRVLYRSEEVRAHIRRLEAAANTPAAS